MAINMTKYENGIHVCETAAKEVGRKRLGGDLGWLELVASFGLAWQPPVTINISSLRERETETWLFPHEAARLARSGGLKWSGLRLNLHLIFVQFWTIHHSLALLLLCIPLGLAPWSDRPPPFLKGISTFLPRGLLCCYLCLLTFVQMGSLLPSTNRISVSLLSVIADPVRNLAIFAGPLPKNDLTSLTLKAKLALTFTNNYITRDTTWGYFKKSM